MNRSDLVKALTSVPLGIEKYKWEPEQLTHREADAVVSAVFDLIGRALKDGETVGLEFGTFGHSATIPVCFIDLRMVKGRSGGVGDGGAASYRSASSDHNDGTPEAPSSSHAGTAGSSEKRTVQLTLGLSEFLGIQRFY